MSDWKLVAEHVAFERSAPIPDAIRPFLDLRQFRVGDHVILHDPALAPGHNWLRLNERRDAVSVRFLEAFTETTPPMVRYYVPTAVGTGFTAETPMYDGYWRATAAEESELPWPAPASEWTERSTFLPRLVAVEQVAVRIAYRGFSMCRLCGQRNGHEGLRLDRWEWPAGYRHYITEHSVRPSPPFDAFIRSYSGQAEPSTKR